MNFIKTAQSIEDEENESPYMSISIAWHESWVNLFIHEKNIQLIFLCSHPIEWTKHVGASDVASLRAVFPGIYIYNLYI